MSNVETFGQRLRRLRLRAGYTQQQLAARLTVSQAAVTAWERQWHAPRPHSMRDLARMLGVTPHYLTEGHEAPVRRAA